MEKTKQITSKDLTIDDLSVFKRQVKERIAEQKEQVISTAQNLIPFSSNSTTSINPLSLVTLPFRRKNVVMNVVEGAVIGYKIVRGIRRLLFRK